MILAGILFGCSVMPTRHNYLLTFLLLAICTLGVLSPADVVRAAALAAAKKDRVDDLVARFNRNVAAHGAPRVGMSVAIGSDGDLTYKAAYGESRPGQAATPDTGYRIGSLTKQFTAAAILRLIEDRAHSARTGKPLALDAPISDYFDGVEAWQVEGQAIITVRSLLNMTTNLPNFTRRPPEGLDPWGGVHASRLLQELKRWRPSGWPNSFEYSNTSYFLLAELIDTMVVADPAQPVTYRDYLRRAVFSRAGLSPAAGFTVETLPADQVAAGNFKRKPVFVEADWLKGSGDMVASAIDVFRWNAAFLGGRVVSASSRMEMLKEGARITPTDYYGMGFFISPRPDWLHYTHTGAVPGFTSANAIAVRRTDGSWHSATLLMNGEGVEGLDQLADDILAVLESD